MANDEMRSVHAERTNGTLDPAVALRRNNCYGMKKSCLGDTTGNREQTGSPQEAREEEVHLFFLCKTCDFPLSLPIGEVYTEPAGRTRVQFSQF